MFYSYVECILKIYDHSYLCDEMTIGSKRIINKYYKATQDVYEAIDGEFQNLYSKLLNDAETQKRLMQTQHKFYMWDMVLMIICTAFLRYLT